MGISSIRTIHKQTSLLNMKTILLFDVFTFALALPYGNIGGDSVQPQIIDVGKLQPQGSQNQPQVGGAVPNQPQLGSGGQTQAQRAPSPGVSCRTEYTTIWDTEYIETEKQECNTIYVNSCSTQYRKKCANVPRQECTTVQDRQCSTVYNEVCVDEYRTEYDSYTETECSTEYKDDCEFQWEGEGNAKVWVPIPGTCKSNPYEKCQDLPKQKERQVAYPVCNKVPEQKCVVVPKQECRTVQEQKCSNEPYQKCDKVPKQDCQSVHKKIPNRISRRVPKKVCDDGSAGSGSIAVRSGSDAIKFE